MLSALPRSTSPALLLRRIPYGESSLVAHVLTPDQGRVHLLAKGAYRRSSRFFCVLDLCHTLELSWTSKPGVELGTLAAGDLRARRQNLPLAPEAFRAATTVLELLDLGAQQGRPEPGLFDLAETALDQLDDWESHDPRASLLQFQLGFLDELGLSPALRACASCGRPAPAQQGDRVPFSAASGGRLCQSCAVQARREGSRVGTLPGPILTASAEAARGTPVDPAVLERCLDFASRFLDVQLEARLKSQRTFLAASNRNAPRA